MFSDQHIKHIRSHSCGIAIITNTTSTMNVFATDISNIRNHTHDQEKTPLGDIDTINLLFTTDFRIFEIDDR